MFLNGAYYNLVCRKTDRGRIGRIEMQVSAEFVRVRWRGGVLEDRVPLKDLMPVQEIEPDDAS